jgi:thiamine-phosphate pyrophosphorylase
MEARQRPWPRICLMTDERIGERLWESIDRLPNGAGIVFRHYSLPSADRARLAVRVAATAKEHGATLAIAADVMLAKRVGAEQVHNPTSPAGELPFSRSVHSLEEAETAASEGATLAFISPIYATRSHPGQKPIGPELAERIARVVGVPAIALGGMDEEKFADLKGFYGWAAIDAWLRVRT